MKSYKFYVALTINAEDENEALFGYNQIKKNIWVSDMYCTDWKEVEN